MVVTPGASSCPFSFPRFQTRCGCNRCGCWCRRLKLAGWDLVSSNFNFLLILLHVGEDLRNARGVSRETAVPLLGGVTLGLVY